MSKLFLFSAFLLPLLFNSDLSAQNIRGFVSDGTSGEMLIGAYLKDKIAGNVTVTDAFGGFTINGINAEKISLRVSYLGYEPLDTLLTVTPDPVMLRLRPKATLPTIEVTVRDPEAQVRSELAVENIPVALLNALPALAGETDPIKSLQLLPGIAAGVEGTSDLYVRGGTPDQNLMLLDGAKVYNANHLFGFLSPFNPSLVKDVKLYKSGFPARFGGRLSSVVEIETEGGNKENWQTTFGLGLINTRFQLSGPLKKNRTSISIGGRTAHLSFLNLIARNAESFQTYAFYDLNVKLNWQYDRSNLSLAFFRNYDRTSVVARTLRTPLEGVLTTVT